MDIHKEPTDVKAEIVMEIIQFPRMNVVPLVFNERIVTIRERRSFFTCQALINLCLLFQYDMI